MIKSVLESFKEESIRKKIEIISNAISLGLTNDNNILAKLTNLPLEEIVEIRKELNK